MLFLSEIKTGGLGETKLLFPWDNYHIHQVFCDTPMFKINILKLHCIFCCSQLDILLLVERGLYRGVSGMVHRWQKINSVSWIMDVKISLYRGQI